MAGWNQLSSPRLRGINAPGQRHANRAAILEAVFRRGPVDQTELGRLTGLSGAAISRIVGELVEEGLLHIATGVASTPNGAGRPRVPLDLDTEHNFVLSMHIGAHLGSVGVHDLRGRIIEHRTVDIDTTESLTETGRRVFGVLAEFTKERIPPGSHVVGTGIGVAGQPGPAGLVHAHPTLAAMRQGLADLGATLGYGPVLVDSLMYGLASAESWFGRFAGSGSLGIVHVGNTVGSAVVAEDLSGRDQAILEGHLGHLSRPGGTRLCACGRRGCFQAEITDEATAEHCRQVLGPRIDSSLHRDSVDVVLAAYQLAKDGNEAALALFGDWAAGIADAVAVVHAVAGVEHLLLIGQTVTVCADILVPLINNHLDLPTSSRTDVEVGSFGEYPALTSAAALVLRRVFRASAEPQESAGPHELRGAQ